MGNSNTIRQWGQTGRYSQAPEKPIVPYDVLRTEVELRCLSLSRMAYLPVCAKFGKKLLTFHSQCELDHYVCITGKKPNHVFRGTCPPHYRI